MSIYRLGAHTPEIAPTAFAAPNADVAGLKHSAADYAKRAAAYPAALERVA